MEEALLQDECEPQVLAATQVTLKVHAFWDEEEEEVLFSLSGSVSPSNNGKLKGHSLRIRKGTGKARLTIVLKDHTGLGLQFLKKEDHPLRIANRQEVGDDDCPPASGLADFRDLDWAPKELKITNPNRGTTERDAEYVYSLHFVEKDGTTRHEFDPIIKNIAWL